MIKGWKNNPSWVTYYEARSEKRIEERIRSIKMQFEHERIMQQISLSLEKPLATIEWGK